MIRKNNVSVIKENYLKEIAILKDIDIKSALETRENELNTKVKKCAKCMNPCTKCKINFLKKEYEYQTVKKTNTSALHFYRNKRNIENFWAN